MAAHKHIWQERQQKKGRGWRMCYCGTIWWDDEQEPKAHPIVERRKYPPK